MLMFEPAGSPTARRFSSALSVERKLPLAFRIWSCSASSPSMDTDTSLTPASFICWARSRLRPRPPVVVSTVLSRARDVEIFGIEVGLAADEHHFARAHLGELVDDEQRLGQRELLVASPAGARAAVMTEVVAAKGQFPHHVRGIKAVVLDFDPPP